MSTDTEEIQTGFRMHALVGALVEYSSVDDGKEVFFFKHLAGYCLMLVMAQSVNKLPNFTTNIRHFRSTIMSEGTAAVSDAK